MRIGRDTAVALPDEFGKPQSLPRFFRALRAFAICGLISRVGDGVPDCIDALLAEPTELPLP
jgi:hypothetical protein